MRRTHWNLILMGAIGGALLIGGIDLMARFQGVQKYSALILALLGVAVMVYARYG